MVVWNAVPARVSRSLVEISQLGATDSFPMCLFAVRSLPWLIGKPFALNKAEAYAI
jgi:hypothetical protein